MRRLSRSVAPELPSSVRQPQYDRGSLKIGVAHIAKAVPDITPIFGGDMARPQMIDPIARDLDGLLSGGARACLAERLRDG